MRCSRRSLFRTRETQRYCSLKKGVREEGRKRKKKEGKEGGREGGKKGGKEGENRDKEYRPAETA